MSLSVTRNYVPPSDRSQPAEIVERSILPVLRHVDHPLLIVALLMGLAGIVVLKGAVQNVPGLAEAGDRQVVFLCMALLAMFAAMLIDYRWLNRMALGLYVANLVALVVVLVVAPRINGVRSWIPLGPINWQPSETMKIATVLVCGQWLALRPEALGTWRGLMIPGLICGIPAFLVLLQPDLGTATLFFCCFLAMMLMAGAPRRMLLVVLLAAIIGGGSAFPFLKTYQRDRLTSFINPESDPGGAGYHLIQARIAIGAGGLTGEGWGNGTQGNGRFLPEHHTDFVFASAIEQFGLLGGVALLAGFALVAWRMIRVVECARDRFGGIVVSGLFAVYLGHVVENVGMNMGLLPITGIPLPFLSYGGSFLITTFILIGLVLNVRSRRFAFIGM